MLEKTGLSYDGKSVCSDSLRQNFGTKKKYSVNFDKTKKV